MKISPNSSSGSKRVASKKTMILFDYHLGIQLNALISNLNQQKRSLLELDSVVENLGPSYFSSNFSKALATSSALSDLFANGWRIKFSKRFVNSFPEKKRKIEAELIRPQILNKGESIESAKERARVGLLRGVVENLNESSTKEFVNLMEDSNNEKSILELIDDPKDLASSLNSGELASENVQPYLQFVEEGGKDDYTKLKLTDIWRYFRLTWSMEYKTNPGRSVRILIRNKARKNHPVMGIAMLASPVISLSSRDERLGLNYYSCIDFMKSQKISLLKFSEIIKSTFSEAKKNISKKDLNRNYRTLRQISYDSLEARKVFLKDQDMENATRHLFRSKRALKLEALEQNIKNSKNLISQVKKEKLDFKDVENNSYFINLVKKFLTQKRTDIISTDIMDLSVCGAVFPYNSLLVGKLITLLMASSEVKSFVDKKYDDSPSIIASKMAGKKIIKQTNLIGLTTTSLYGVGSSQYNRLKLTQDNSKIKKDIIWEELASTKGFGTFHFSKKTRKLLQTLQNETQEYQNINYEFGEGTSPALRRISESLNEIGFNKSVLKHEFYRKTYFCDLSSNIKKIVFNFANPKMDLNSVNQISKAWKNRYFLKRISNNKILVELEKKKISDYLVSSKIKN